MSAALTLLRKPLFVVDNSAETLNWSMCREEATMEILSAK